MVSDKQRHQAVQRALKMNFLFKDPAFDNIMKALDKPSGTQDPAGCHTDAREHDFYAALAGLPLNQDEIDWLWNYLQHCHEVTDKNNPGGWDNVPEAMAASVGW